MTAAIPVSTYFTNVSGTVASSTIDTGLNNIANPLNVVNQYTVYGTDTGVADAYVVTAPAGLSASLVAGLGIVWTCTNANATTTPTLAVYGTTAKVIVNQNGTALTASQLVNGGVYYTVYNGTNWVLMNGLASSITTATTTQQFRITGTTSVSFYTGTLTRTNNIVTFTTTLTTATSNATTLTMVFTSGGVDTPMASTYRPSNTRTTGAIVINNGYATVGSASVFLGGNSISLSALNYDALTGVVLGGFQSSGTKGIGAQSFVWTVD